MRTTEEKIATLKNEPTLTIERPNQPTDEISEETVTEEEAEANADADEALPGDETEGAELPEAEAGEPQIEIEEEGVEEIVAECEFTTVIFLGTAVEAEAVLAVRPEILPAGYTGRFRACPVKKGFDHTVTDGARVVGFSITCNLAARAHDALEVPMQMAAMTRRTGADKVEGLRTRVRPNDPESKERYEEAREEFKESLIEAMKVQEAIPVRHYNCKEVSRDSEVLMDVDY